MSTLLKNIDTFFFRKISAGGFGLMRMFWGLTILWWMGTMYKHVPFFFSDAGLIPTDLGYLSFRSEYRFTLLEYIVEPNQVYMLYFAMLIAALLTTIGKWARVSTTVTVILFFSFQERNLLPLCGGDTVLRCIGFMLVICPELRAFSIGRAVDQWKNWQKKKKLLPDLQMSIWPYRLLLWQATIIYLFSGIEKGLGTMWWDGTAAAAVYHHTHFTMFPKWVMDILSGGTAIVSYFTLIYELAWMFILVPHFISRRLPQVIHPGSYKRALLLGGLIFHLGIGLTMNVGIFVVAILVMYLGLMLPEDWKALKAFFNRKRKGKTHLLFDGHCGLCQRSVCFLHQMDSLGRLDFVDFHDEKRRKKIDPTLKFADLDKAMHMKTVDGRTEKGFDGFRMISWDIIWLWPIAPLLYIPGIPVIGRRIYAEIAKRRRKCDHEGCAM
ncbi:MAG: DCC1-like thiol-disulfide oxidoreductase family protein [bacterium]|nr:DCC1-like thiol-disulfide oxidoreductase family protein [bacterium]